MENLTPFYDNTLSDSFFNLKEHQALMSDKEKNQFMQVLTNSLDLQELGRIAFAEVKARLNAKFLTVVSRLETFRFGDNSNKQIVKRFELPPLQDGEVRIEYGFERTLSLRESQLLRDFNQCIRNPVRNALQFFNVQKLALKDALTSLGNRLQFDETLRKATSQAHRSGENVSLIVMDLDKFKPVNDKYGHSEGDKVLMSVAGAISQSLRDSDHAFRFGGDEFCCITTNTDMEANNRIVRRIQNAIKTDPLLKKHNISGSFGITMFTAKDTVDSFFDRADGALYEAKEGGRNCAIWA